MTDTQKKSFIREFNSHKDELMTVVEELRGKIKSNVLVQIYGSIAVTEFSFNYRTNEGFIYKLGEHIKVI